MSTKKITALTELSSAPAATDMFPVVDVSDTTDASSGTTKKITATNIGKALGIGAGNTTAEPMKINTSSGKIGIGTNVPLDYLHLSTAAGAGISLSRADNPTTSGERLGELNFSASEDSGSNWGTGAQIKAFATESWAHGSAQGSELRFYTTDNTTATLDQRVTIDQAGNLLVGGTATPASSTGNLCLFNNTAPSGSVSNGIVLYAEDVSTSELRVRDEAGNVTTLSPHNFDMLEEKSDPMAWAYYAKNVFVGKEISVDMMKVIRAVEKLTGETFIKVRDIDASEKLDWDEEEQKKVDASKQELADYKKRKKEGNDTEEKPEVYKKKPKPSWLK